MLKTAEPKKSGNRVGGGSRARRGGSKMDDVEVDGGEVEVDEVGKIEICLSPKIGLSPKRQ